MHYLCVDKLIEEKEKQLQQKDTELQQKDTELQQKDQEMKALIRNMVFEAVKELGNLSENAYGRIKKEMDINILKAMHKVALKSDSAEQFENQIANL